MQTALPAGDRPSAWQGALGATTQLFWTIRLELYTGAVLLNYSKGTINTFHDEQHPGGNKRNDRERQASEQPILYGSRWTTV